MAPKGWTADDQSEFLRGQEGDFRKAQVTRRFDDLWNSIMAEWVRRWPVIDSVFPGQNLKVEDLDESQSETYNKALEKLRIRIKQWIFWRFNQRGRQAAGGSTSKDLRKILANLGGRVLKEYEMYVKVVAEGFEDYHNEACASMGLTGRKMIQAWHTNAKAFYAMATKEEREEVAARMGEQLEIKNAVKTTEEKLSPAQHQHFLNILPGVLSATVDPAVRKAGVMAFVCVVGPVPKEGGKIVATSYQFGDNKDTPLFASTWEKYDQVFTDELGSFARRHLFSKEVCAQRVLLDSKKSEDADVDKSLCDAPGASPSVHAKQDDTFPDSSATPPEKGNSPHPTTSGVFTNPETRSPEEGNTASAHPSAPTHSADGSVSPPGAQLYLPHSLPPNHPDIAINPPTASCVENYATHLNSTSSLGASYIGNQTWSSFDISDAPWADPAALEALACEMDPSRPTTGSFLPNAPSSSSLIHDRSHTLNGYLNNLDGGVNHANALDHTGSLQPRPAAFQQVNVVSHPDPASALLGLSGTHVGNVTTPISSFEPIPWPNVVSFPQEHLAAIQPAVPTARSSVTTNHLWTTTTQAAGTAIRPNSGTTTTQPIEETTQPTVSRPEETIKPTVAAENPPAHTTSTPLQQTPPAHATSTPLQQTPPAQPPASPIPPPASSSLFPDHPSQAPPPPGQTSTTLTQSSLPAAPAQEPPAAGHTEVRRSTRSAVPSTRLEKLNAIGTNPTPPKFSPPDLTVPPPWFDPAVKYLSSRSDLGPQFLSVVEKWRGLEVQARYGGKSLKGLSPKGRPEEWAKFKPIKATGLRNYASGPNISDAAEFGIAIARWWMDMQPLFRQSTSSDLPLPIYSGALTLGDPWGQVRRFGTTGLSCLLTMMSWWGSATLTPSLWNDDPKPLWEGVVNDLDKVLDALVATPPSLKRPLDDVDASGDKENKRPRI
ncbi:hypothetical protein MD484_g6555, partial [Candolleomyces efflorescens]